MTSSAQHPGPGYISGCGTILRALHLHQRQHLGRSSTVLMGLGLAGSLTGMAIGVPAAARTGLALHGALALCIGAMLAIFGAATLLSFISRAALQNTPANAVLVPGLNRSVRRTAVMLWLITMLGFCLFASVLPKSLLIVLAANWAIVAFAWLSPASRLNGIGFVATCAPLLAQLAPWDALDTPAVLAVLHAATLVLGWHTLGRAFPCGGEHHYARTGEQRKGERAGRSTIDLAQHNKRKGGALPLYRRMFDADVASGKPQRLMLHVLGPGNQLSDVILPSLGVATIAIVLKLLVLVWWPQHQAAAAMAAMIIGAPLALVMPLSSAWRFVINLRASAAEQSLFRLTPAAPGAQTLNRVVARSILRMCLTEWLGALLLLLSVAWICGATPALLIKGLTLMCGTLALVGWPLRDYARDRELRWPAILLSLVLLAGLIAAVLALVVSDAAPWLWAPLLAASAGFIGYRYRAMLAAPVAFPARRMQGHA